MPVRPVTSWLRIANEVRFGVKGKQSMDGMKGMEGMDHK
jgi:hypothetical protein